MKNNTIIVVEDELAIALDMRVILQKAGYNPIINITSVEQAIESIKENNPILVLIDINLNKSKDGIALGEYLLEDKKIPYLYITSYSDKLTLDRVNATRPDGYIVKPFRPDNLLAAISVVLNNYNFKEVAQNRLEEELPFALKKVVNYIDDNIDKKIELEDLVRITAWKRTNFTRIFRKYLRVSPYQFVLIRKIDKAEKLLHDKMIPLSQIASELGFQSYSNFCNAFKKIKQVTPESYKEKRCS
jgi:AraC-like DNA-binding protein/CheY-like chemotaxis protein